MALEDLILKTSSSGWWSFLQSQLRLFTFASRKVCKPLLASRQTVRLDDDDDNASNHRVVADD